MIPARTFEQTETAALPRTPAATPPPAFAATITTCDGRPITGGLALVRDQIAGWTATLTQLDRPGMVASAYFGDRVREVILRLSDGRHARARITGTTFVAAAERVCELSGLEPLTSRLPVL
jgi:hypothetical protein